MGLSKNFRFWFPIVVLIGIAAYSTYGVLRVNFFLPVDVPHYEFCDEIPPIRGGIYCSSHGRGGYPIVKSMPSWEYRLDPIAMTNRVVKPVGSKTPRTPKEQAQIIASMLKIEPERIYEMMAKTGGPGFRNQFLAVSGDKSVYDTLSDRSEVSGVKITETYERKYFESNRLSHVIKGVTQKYNKELQGIPGQLRGKKDANGRLIKDKIELNIPSKPGADIHLTVDHFLQKLVETELAAGVAEYGASSGWCVILDVKTAKVLAMSSYPELDVTKTYDEKDPILVNKVIGHTYEPGSVMKVVTAAAAIDAGFTTPKTRFSTKRDEKNSLGEYKYYKLPNDSHSLPPTITLTEAIVESSNIVIGKLGYDFGRKRLYEYMTKFGFGKRVGIDLPNEEKGILGDYRKWDKATWSRAPIGQGISVTPIQMASAYQTIANDGIRKRPYVVDKIINSDGEDLRNRQYDSGERVISASTAYVVREMMLNVATKQGTARRAKIPGYSIAGKTGTAQKVVNGKYAPGLYVATFCGIVPSGVVKRYSDDIEPVPPEVVVLVSLDFNEKRQYHQGGNSAGPVFKRITEKAMRYLEVVPDRLDEVGEEQF